jgi:hypothetical protein
MKLQRSTIPTDVIDWDGKQSLSSAGRYRDQRQAGGEICLQCRAPVDGRRKALEGVGTFVAPSRKTGDLSHIAQPITTIDEDAVLVAHLGRLQMRVDHAGDVDNACPSGEELGLSRQVVVEGVVYELVSRLAAHRLDHRDRLALAA